MKINFNDLSGQSALPTKYVHLNMRKNFNNLSPIKSVKKFIVPEFIEKFLRISS